MSGKLLSLKFVATAVVTVGLLVLGGLNIQQKRLWVVPEDGCSWIQTAQGVEARIVTDGGPAARAGAHVGDILTKIDDRKIGSDQDVTKILYELGVWKTPIYTLKRNGVEFKTTRVVITPLNQQFVRQRLFLEIIG